MSHSGMTPEEAAAYREALKGINKDWINETLEKLTPLMPDDLILSMALNRLRFRGIVPPCEVRIVNLPQGLTRMDMSATPRVIEIAPVALRHPQLDDILLHEINWANQN